MSSIVNNDEVISPNSAAVPDSIFDECFATLFPDYLQDPLSQSVLQSVEDEIDDHDISASCGDENMSASPGFQFVGTTTTPFKLDNGLLALGGPNFFKFAEGQTLSTNIPPSATNTPPPLPIQASLPPDADHTMTCLPKQLKVQNPSLQNLISTTWPPATGSKKRPLGQEGCSFPKGVPKRSRRMNPDSEALLSIVDTLLGENLPIMNAESSQLQLEEQAARITKESILGAQSEREVPSPTSITQPILETKPTVIKAPDSKKQCPSSGTSALKTALAAFAQQMDEKKPDHEKKKNKRKQPQQHEAVVHLERMRYASQEEKKRIHRERNRIHARNLRLRKKAREDELKKKVQDLTAQRETALADQANQATVLKQNKNIRFIVVDNFLKLLQDIEETRLSNPGCRWDTSTLLKEDISMTIPRHGGGHVVTEQLVNGIQPLLDCWLDLVKSLQWALEEPNLVITFHCDRKSFVMDGCTTIAKIQVRCSQAALPEESPSQAASGNKKTDDRTLLLLAGSLKTRFCVQTNKIQSGSLLLDFGTVFLNRTRKSLPGF